MVLADGGPITSVQGDLEDRVRRTLALMHRWGYAPRIDALAAQLLGGPAREVDVRAILNHHRGFSLRGDFACLAGSEGFLRRSEDRIRLSGPLAEEAWDIARDYTRDLVRSCPFVQVVGVSGSLASGGFGASDDIDFDLVARSGSKYTVYLVAHLVGLKYALRYRKRKLDELHHTPLLPKITCINVVWTEDQIRPFERRDENMAFELVRCIPVVGTDRFLDALQANPWIEGFFPQVRGRVFGEEAPSGRNVLGRVLEAVLRNPSMAALLERVSRRIAWRLYRGVQGSRSRNPTAKARMDFLRRAKYPYEVFQD